MSTQTIMPLRCLYLSRMSTENSPASWEKVIGLVHAVNFRGRSYVRSSQGAIYLTTYNQTARRSKWSKAKLFQKYFSFCYFFFSITFLCAQIWQFHTVLSHFWHDWMHYWMWLVATNLFGGLLSHSRFDTLALLYSTVPSFTMRLRITPSIFLWNKQRRSYLAEIVTTWVDLSFILDNYSDMLILQSV